MNDCVCWNLESHNELLASICLETDLNLKVSLFRMDTTIQLHHLFFCNPGKCLEL